MIDFRYHVVSIVAVFLALAVGIVLGSATLKAPILRGGEQITQDLRNDRQDLREDIVDLEQQVRAGEGFAEQIAPRIVDGRLDDRSVLIVAAPGAEDPLVSDVAVMLEQAGASVAGTVSLRERYLEEDTDGQLDDLVAELLPSGEDLSASSPHQRAALGLATVLIAPQQGATAGQGDLSGSALGLPARAVLDALQESGYLQTSGILARSAGTAVVVAPAAPDMLSPQPVDARAREDALVALVAALDERGLGTVVTGPASAAGPGGLLTAVRSGSAGDEVTTVDSAETTAGRVAVVFGLQEQLRGGSGDYGVAAGASGGPLPDLPVQ